MYCPNCKNELSDNSKLAQNVKECKTCEGRYLILETTKPKVVEKQKTSMIEEFEKYLNETPFEQLQKDWDKVSQYHGVGPTVNEMLDNWTKNEIELTEDLLPFVLGSYAIGRQCEIGIITDNTDPHNVDVEYRDSTGEYLWLGIYCIIKECYEYDSIFIYASNLNL